MKIEINKIYCEDCLVTMGRLESNVIDLTITSPPYDGMREYVGYSFDFVSVATELFRVTKVGGVVVWVVSDQTINGSESGTSFKQALTFIDVGFKLYDTMIWNKQNCSSIGSLNRYENTFEYMFILSKGVPKTTNIIKDKVNQRVGELQHGSIRQTDGSVRKTSGYGKRVISEFGRRSNVWTIFPAKSKSERLHPAPFPEKLVTDHILSWSNEGDLVYDPFMGSGTVAKMCVVNNRNYIGSDVSNDYCEIANNRVASAQLKLFS